MIISYLVDVSNCNRPYTSSSALLYGLTFLLLINWPINVSESQTDSEHSYVPYNLYYHIIYLVSLSKSKGNPGGLESVRSEADRHLYQIPEEDHPASASLP